MARIDYLLLRSGDYLLLRTGDKLILRQVRGETTSLHVNALPGKRRTFVAKAAAVSAVRSNKLPLLGVS